MKLRHSHLGLCVTDIEAALRFYRNGLGFELVNQIAVDGHEELFELRDVKFVAFYLVNGPHTLELFQFESPNQKPHPGVRSLNQPGFTHLSFEVDDIDEVRRRIIEYGGTARDSTRTAMRFGSATFDEDCVDELTALMCTDPDGNRIELVKTVGAPRGRLGDKLCWEP